MTGQQTPALLVLEDGTVFRGGSLGQEGETFGELVFNTGMTGYQEVLTDPSYRGQIVVMTYPEIGIYGVNPEDVESSQIQVAGFVVHRAVRQPFNWRATQAFDAYLNDAGIVAIEGVDTRQLTRHLRTHGAMRGVISTVELDPERLLERVRQSPSMKGRNLAREVTVREPIEAEPLPSSDVRIAIVDAGCKGQIIRDLRQRGTQVVRVPYDTHVEDLLTLNLDGVLISNGPGDPEPLSEAIDLVRALLAVRIPVAGICLGHQLLGLAIGGQTYKMRFGHRGVNHPVKEMASGRIVITTQNHGFAVDPTSLGIRWAPLDSAYIPTQPDLCPDMELGSGVTMAEILPEGPLVGESPAGYGPVEVTHLSLNDGTVEGLRLRDYPAFSVQFHPEAAPGPHDARAFFDQFLDMVRGSHA